MNNRKHCQNPLIRRRSWLLVLLTGFVAIACAATAQAQATRPSVLATFEYHQLTNFTYGGASNHEGGRIGFNGTTIAYAYKPYGKKVGEVWAIGYDGANYNLLDRYPEDYKGTGWANSRMVDISVEGPVHVIHSNGQNLRVVPLDNVGRKAGEAREVFEVETASVTNIRMGAAPFVLLHRAGYRSDAKPRQPIEAGVHRVAISGSSTPVLTAQMVANLIGCEAGDVNFSGGGRFHFDVSLNNRIVAVLHINPNDKKHELTLGCYLVGLDMQNNRPFIIAKKTGKDSKYFYNRITISPDGNRIAYVKHTDGQVVVADFDGSNSKVLLKRDSKIGFPGSSSPFQLDLHGKFLLVGETGLLMKTDGSYIRGLGNSPRGYSMLGETLPKTYMGSWQFSIGLL